MDLRQCPEYARYLSRTGWDVATLRANKQPVFVYLKPLVAGLKFAKVQRYDALDLTALERLRRRHRVIYLVLEPAAPIKIEAYRQERYCLSRSAYLPTKTLVLDLGQSKTEIFAAFSKNLKRTLNRPPQAKAVTADPEEFYYFWRRHSRLWPMPKESFLKLMDSFGAKGRLYASRLNDQLISGVILLQTPTTAYYYQAWTAPLGRAVNAHHHLVWQILQELKIRRIKTFDFDGLDDPRFPRRSWQGFSRFKRQWGGREIEYPGSFQRWF